MGNTPMLLRAVCGHDSRSVDGCLHCEAADEIERLRALLRDANTVLQENKKRIGYAQGSPVDKIVRAVQSACEA